MLDGELVEWHVGVEGVDDPVAVRPDLAIVVEVQTVGVTIARGVQPITNTMFAIIFQYNQHTNLFNIAFWIRRE